MAFIQKTQMIMLNQINLFQHTYEDIIKHYEYHIDIATIMCQEEYSAIIFQLCDIREIHNKQDRYIYKFPLDEIIQDLINQINIAKIEYSSLESGFKKQKQLRNQFFQQMIELSLILISLERRQIKSLRKIFHNIYTYLIQFIQFVFVNDIRREEKKNIFYNKEEVIGQIKGKKEENERSVQSYCQKRYVLQCIQR
ncbi:unnamed protein product [Paramecium primaurelia]|uniref:Uncharacterized protein n=1 Tax=Paramecium primaurelia TaxID=5886 RepID=A0A8S1LA54_PARPR|nr:unnamed protein product [Paramecium primaurelia]